ncbi:hypothetical protein MY11210_003299 [Beauveria gryllotalpidicola]
MQAALHCAQVYFVALGGTVQGTYERHDVNSVLINRLQLQESASGTLHEKRRSRTASQAGAATHQTTRQAPALNATLFHRMLTTSIQVEGEVQGEETSVDKLLKDVGQGPSGATVVKLTQETRDVIANEAGFAVRH